MCSNAAAPPPDSGNLYQAALSYLARYAATEVGLRRVLTRHVDRWARLQADPDAAVTLKAREAIEGVIGRLVEARVVSDKAFAESRAKSLARGGQSSRSVQARLIAKGVPRQIAQAASIGDEDTELAAALVLSRRRRIGPYRTSDDADNTIRPKEMGMLARAGFTRDIADRALRLSREEAESRIFELRR